MAAFIGAAFREVRDEAHIRHAAYRFKAKLRMRDGGASVGGGSFELAAELALNGVEIGAEHAETAKPDYPDYKAPIA